MIHLSPRTATAARITIYAAASLTDALKQIRTGYEKASGDQLVFSFGASSTLARQIDEGAPADVFLSADDARMNALERSGRLLPGTRTNRLSNTLVIIVAADSPLRLPAIHHLTNATVARLAVAEPRSVPAGIYAKDYLSRLGLWTTLVRKVVPTDNVRSALAAVESGNVDAGIVYKTDAAISSRVRVALEVAQNDGPEIRYPAAVLRDSREPEAARRFLQHLGSDEALKIFGQFGFLLHQPPAR